MSDVKFEVYGTAKEIFKARDDEVLYVGPAGTGKSYACLLKVHLFCLQNPGVRVMLIRKTLNSLTNTGVVTYKSQIAKDLLETGEVTWYGGSPSESPSFRYSNGSVVLLGGLDNATKIMSAEYDLCYIQEATEITEGDWEAVTTRLRNNKAGLQQLLADANPGPPTHWLKLRCDKGLTRMVNSKHEDNPLLFDQKTGEITLEGTKYMRKLDNLTGVRYLRLRKGIWAAAEGLVYGTFDPAVHLIDKFNPPAEWRRWWAVDFGYTNPFVCQFWAEDHDGRLYLYREVYWTKRLVEDHARFILKLVQDPDSNEWTEPRPFKVIGDHDAEGRETFYKHSGLRITAAKKEVSKGIQAVESRFKIQGDGKPRLFIMKNVVVERDPALEEKGLPCSTEEEITGYIWDIKEGKAPKEDPVKENDHGMDAMRYLVMARERGALPRARMLT